MVSRPLITITLAYILGLILGNYLPSQHFYLLFSTLLFFILSCYAYLKGSSSFNYLILITFILFGLTYSQRDKLVSKDIAKFGLNKAITLTGTIIKEPRVRENKITFELKVEKIFSSGKAYSLKEKVLVNAYEVSDLNYGDKVKIFGKLRSPKETGNPGELSYKDYLSQQGIHRVVSTSRIKKLGKGDANPLIASAIFLKNKMVKIQEETLPSTKGMPFAPLISGIVFGSQAVPIPQDLEEATRRTGIIHILVASGAQIALLLGVLLFLFKLGRFTSPLSLFVSLVIIIFLISFYALMAGGGPSILRAVVMGVILLLANLLEREYDPLTSLSLAAFLLLIVSPSALYNIGFQLSFAVCFGIIYLAPEMIRSLKKFVLPGFERVSFWLIALFCVCLSAQVMVIPLLAYYFNQVSLISLLANLFIVPLVAILLPFGLLSGLLGLISLKLALIVNILNTFLLFLLIKLTFFFSYLPRASIFVSPPSMFTVVTCYALLIGGMELWKSPLKSKVTKEKLLIVILIFLTIFTFQFAFKGTSKDLTVTFIDVGQGDSILIQVPSGKDLLIDGGGSPEYSDFDLGEKIVLPFLYRQGVRFIDAVILTHPDNDHLQGLLSVLKNLRVGLVLDSAQKSDNPYYPQFLKIIKEKNIPYQVARKGEILNLGKGIKAYLLHPEVPLLSNTNADINNNGVVLKLIYKKVSFLFMADLEEEGEDRLLSEKINLKSTILKVGHHGGPTSSSEKFLQAVEPEAAVISVGEYNTFGHPNKGVLERLQNLGARIYRTDKNGAVVITTNGESYQIKVVRDSDSPI